MPTQLQINHHAKQKFLAKIQAAGMIPLTEYKNATTPLIVRCPHGHEKKAFSFQSVSAIGGCMPCRSEASKLAFLAKLATYHYILKGEYTDSKTKVAVACTNGHQWLVVPNGFDPAINTCKYCMYWEQLQATPHKSVLIHQRILFRYAQKHGLSYTIPKKVVAFETRGALCQVLKCEPSQAYLAHIVETHDLPWDVPFLTTVLIALEKWKYRHFNTQNMMFHKETMVACVLYGWSRHEQYFMSQQKLCDWVGITTTNLRTWWRRLGPFFAKVRVN